MVWGCSNRVSSRCHHHISECVRVEHGEEWESRVEGTRIRYGMGRKLGSGTVGGEVSGSQSGLSVTGTVAARCSGDARRCPEATFRPACPRVS